MRDDDELVDGWRLICLGEERLGGGCRSAGSGVNLGEGSGYCTVPCSGYCTVRYCEVMIVFTERRTDEQLEIWRKGKGEGEEGEDGKKSRMFFIILFVYERSKPAPIDMKPAPGPGPGPTYDDVTDVFGNLTS